MKISSPKGYSLSMWIVTLGIAIVGIFFFQGTVKRTLVTKTLRTTDHLFWGNWGQPVLQYKGGDKEDSNTISSSDHLITFNQKRGQRTTGTVETLNSSESFTANSHD